GEHHVPHRELHGGAGWVHLPRGDAHVGLLLLSHVVVVARFVMPGLSAAANGSLLAVSLTFVKHLTNVKFACGVVRSAAAFRRDGGALHPGGMTVGLRSDVPALPSRHPPAGQKVDGPLGAGAVGRAKAVYGF